ncbi:HesA/MoeB/ThiF family protein [Mesorhizobium sp. LjRoot246]|uniref:HesA/MoeB/ThiF family protein n=1 Tax=Mesorhizobium sp. LjRoot246 TaxID=3342294 RepID=UPI003ECF26C6
MLLYTEGAETIALSSDDLDLKSALPALLRGTSLLELQRMSPHGVSREAAAEAASELISLLEKAGVLQREVDTSGFPEDELRHFSSVIAYFGRYESRESDRIDYFRKLRAARILQVGLGGLGSSALMYLVGCGVGHVLGVDPDVLETGNVARQVFYSRQDVGRSKVDAAADAVTRLSPYTRFIGIQEGIASADDLLRIIHEYGPFDLILQTADAPIWDLTKWIATAARTSNIPSLHSSYLGVGPLHLPYRTACPACMLPKVEAQLENHEEILNFERGLVSGGIPRAVLATSLGHYGVHLAQETVTFLTGSSKAHTIGGLKRIFINGEPSTWIEPIDRDPRCSICGAAKERAA